MRKIMRNTCNPSKPLLDFEKAKAYRNQASLIYDKDFKLGFKGEKKFFYRFRKLEYPTPKQYIFVDSNSHAYAIFMKCQIE